MARSCFVCGKPLGRNPRLVTCETEDGGNGDVFVGSGCGKLIDKEGAGGLQLEDGTILYSLRHDPDGRPTLLEIGQRLERAYRDS